MEAYIAVKNIWCYCCCYR